MTTDDPSGVKGAGSQGSSSSAEERDQFIPVRKADLLAALASEASGQGGDSMVRAHSASEDARERAGDTRPEPGSSARESTRRSTYLRHRPSRD
jgi:hypothetical protein